MAEDDVAAPPAGDRPPVEGALLDVEHRSALDQVLLDAFCAQLHIDAVAARNEEDLVDLAGEGVPKVRVDRVSGGTDRATEVRHRVAEDVEDPEGARHARSDGRDVEDEAGGPTRDEKPRRTGRVARDLDRPHAVVVPPAGIR